MKLKSLQTSAALILITLMLVVAAGTTVATAQTYTDLFNFDDTDGAGPTGILAQGRDGNLYGTTPDGGANGWGTVFRITPNGKLTTLYSFCSQTCADGQSPYGGLVLGADGNFYGTTVTGGSSNYGTIFKITKSGELTTLYNFTGGADGGSPYAPPIQGGDGSFYGTTAWVGTAYKITSLGAFTLLGDLPSGSGAPLLQATDGNFYGISSGGSAGVGTVFKITTKGVVTTIYNFDTTHGAYPDALIQGSDGNFYGTTSEGGSYGDGVAYELTPQGVITVLHNFPDPNYPNDGNQPEAGLVQATDGNFYGVTCFGGATSYGVIFQITLAGIYSILYDFVFATGATPYLSIPMQHTNGEIYGETYWGGSSGNGVVYSFGLGLGPFVSLVSTSAKVGKPIGILGQGFTGTTAVSFNGTAATFTVVRDTYLVATVPTGTTTGFVTVTTPGGTLTSSQEFTVKP